MKNIVLVIAQSILGLLTLMIVMTIYGGVNRSIELKSNLSSVVEETLSDMMLSQKYSINNTNDILTDFTTDLAVVFDSTSDITVDVMQCDAEKGILSVRVTVSYLQPTGRNEKISCERTAIFNKLSD